MRIISYTSIDANALVQMMINSMRGMRSSEKLLIVSKLLKFGFEIQLVVMRISAQEATKAAGRPRVVDAMMGRDIYANIRTQMKKTGILATFSPGKHKPDYSAWNITSDNSILTNTSSMEFTPKSKKIDRIGVEIISPIFTYNDTQ